MSEATKRSTVYFEPDIHHALRLKSEVTHTTVSDIVNGAVRRALEEDKADLAAFDQRAHEPSISLDALLADLKSHGKI